MARVIDHPDMNLAVALIIIVNTNKHIKSQVVKLQHS